jgi:hypothetical protein
MNEDGPNDSPYGTLVKHDQSETKRDIKVHKWEDAWIQAAHEIVQEESSR